MPALAQQGYAPVKVAPKPKPKPVTRPGQPGASAAKPVVKQTTQLRIAGKGAGKPQVSPPGGVSSVAQAHYINAVLANPNRQTFAQSIAGRTGIPGKAAGKAANPVGVPVMNKGKVVAGSNKAGGIVTVAQSHAINVKLGITPAAKPKVATAPITRRTTPATHPLTGSTPAHNAPTRAKPVSTPASGGPAPYNAGLQPTDQGGAAGGSSSGLLDSLLGSASGILPIIVIAIVL